MPAKAVPAEAVPINAVPTKPPPSSVRTSSIQRRLRAAGEHDEGTNTKTMIKIRVRAARTGLCNQRVKFLADGCSDLQESAQ